MNKTVRQILKEELDIVDRKLANLIVICTIAIILEYLLVALAYNAAASTNVSGYVTTTCANTKCHLVQTDNHLIFIPEF